FDLERGHLRLVRAPSTLLATGGAGRLHLEGAPTANHFGATGDGLVLAYRAGVPRRDLDRFQYHPPALARPKHLDAPPLSDAATASWRSSRLGTSPPPRSSESWPKAAAFGGTAPKECSSTPPSWSSANPGCWRSASSPSPTSPRAPASIPARSRCSCDRRCTT